MIVTPQHCGWSTLKDTPKDASLISHQLMLRAGLITSSASGIYTWLPIGLRALQRVEAVIRETLSPIAQEMLMPMVQPATLWQETERWQAYGPELLRFKDRHDRDFCLGPTHEEIITDWARHQLKSYKQLPLCVYQIQTKFRDEIRPRFGVMRAREFMMKDAYSFHLTQDSLQHTYDEMREAYGSICFKLGLDYRVVEADSGSIGGQKSHEFQVVSESGEDALVYCPNSEYAANIEQATAQSPEPAQAPHDTAPTSTPQAAPASDLTVQLAKGTDTPWVALILRTEDTLNSIKAEKHPALATPLQLASPTETTEALSIYADLASLNLPFIVDHWAAALSDFNLTLGNISTTHVFWHRDLQWQDTADLRTVQAGDPSPDGSGTLHIERGIEVGHIFQLGSCYSAPMSATVLDDTGTAQPLQMGCYGIGVSRLIAAGIEQHHDAQGICWPKRMAPFDIHILGFQSDKNPEVSNTAHRIAQMLSDAGYEVFLDLRPARPGTLLADADLLGLPWRCVISPRTIEQSGVEMKARTASEAKLISENSILAHLQAL